MTTRLYDWNYEVIDIGPNGKSRIVIACGRDAMTFEAAIWALFWLALAFIGVKVFGERKDKDDG